ncbi:hypothetical protein DZA29_25090 [Citrobacter gillenii]|nr:hypothetical protein DZA29_25090 [Citrobacter gillenii]
MPSAFIRRSPPGHVGTKKSPAAACGDGIRRDFTVARPHRPQGFASPPSSPVRTLHGHSAREGFALRLAASPLRPPLFAGLSCRHGDAGTENMLTVEDV